MKLKIENLNCGYDDKVIVKDISFSIETGDILCILGANGVGKTTLFKTILGFLNSKGGNIYIDDKDIQGFNRREFAKNIGYVPQGHTPPFPYKVIDVVVMGRTAYLDIFSSPGYSDYNIAKDILKSLGIEELKDKPYTEISGGERQLVLIARALAQEPKILIMDEPTSNLDYGNQIRVLEHIKRLANKDIGIIMTSHFPNHAFMASNKVLVMNSGSEFITGEANNIINSDLLKELYGVDIQVENVIDNINKEEVKICVPIMRG